MTEEGKTYIWISDGVDVVVSTVIFGRQLWPDKPLQLVGGNGFAELARLTRDARNSCRVLTVEPEAEALGLSLYHCVVGATIMIVVF
jgi:hypothetical protein